MRYFFRKFIFVKQLMIFFSENDFIFYNTKSHDPVNPATSRKVTFTSNVKRGGGGEPLCGQS